MLRSGKISKAPLLPVKPERYRKLGLQVASRQRSWRPGRLAGTAWRRCSYWLLSTLQFLGENLGALRKTICLAHIVVLLGFFGKGEETLDSFDYVLPRGGDRAPSDLVQNLGDLATAALRLILQALQLGGWDNFLHGFARRLRRRSRDSRRRSGRWRAGAVRAVGGGEEGLGLWYGLHVGRRGVQRLRRRQRDMSLRDGERSRRRSRRRRCCCRLRRRRHGRRLCRFAAQHAAGKRHGENSGEECLGFHGSHRDGQADQERGAFSRFACEIDCTIVKLHDSERHGQTNSRALFLGAEIEAEDFFAELWSDARG